MNDYQENFRDPETIKLPEVEDTTSSCSGGECLKRDECLHYHIYLKLKDKARKNYGSATCLGYGTTFNSFDIPFVEIYHRFKQK